jgi:hypothetical protein
MGKMIVLYLLMSATTWGANHAPKPIVLTHPALSHLKNSQTVRSIGDAFESAVTQHQICPKCVELFPNAVRYASLIGSSFMAVEMEANEFGGFFVLIVFKDHPKLFRLWAYETDTGKFQIREMTPLPLTLNGAIMNELADKDYAPYWRRATH